MKYMISKMSQIKKTNNEQTSNNNQAYKSTLKMNDVVIIVVNIN